MRKISIVILVIALTFGLVACGGNSSESGDPKNMFEAMSIAAENTMSSYDPSRFVYVYVVDGKPMRATGAMTEELYEKLSDVNVFDENISEEAEELLKSIEIINLEDLSKNIPPQEELDKLIGKTGQELLDEGYEPNGYSLFEGTTIFWMDKGDYEYEATFEEELEDPAEGVEYADMMKDLTLKSIKYNGVSFYATDLGEN